MRLEDYEDDGDQESDLTARARRRPAVMTDSANVTNRAPDASAQSPPELRICDDPSCGVTFAPRTTWQRFHTDACRRNFHRTQGRPPMRGVIKGMRVLKRGKVAITVHFGIEEQDRSRQLTPGEVIEIV